MLMIVILQTYNGSNVVTKYIENKGSYFLEGEIIVLDAKD